MPEQGSRQRISYGSADSISQDTLWEENRGVWRNVGDRFRDRCHGCERGRSHGSCAHRRRESVDRAVARLPKGTEGYALDLSNEEYVRDSFTHLGACDHLVFTAGERVQRSELSETSAEQARHVFDLRFWGAFMAAKYGSSQIRPGGSVVLTSGIARRRPRKGLTVGAGICGAVEALTRALAVELAPIRINAVCPGPVRTEMWMSMSEEDQEAMARSIGQALLIGRVGEAHDLAHASLYLMREGCEHRSGDHRRWWDDLRLKHLFGEKGKDHITQARTGCS